MTNEKEKPLKPFEEMNFSEILSWADKEARKRLANNQKENSDLNGKDNFQ